jgi:hypothetical protein
LPVIVDICLAYNRNNAMSIESTSSARSFSPPPISSKQVSALNKPSLSDARATQSFSPPVSSISSQQGNLVNLSPQGRSLQQNDFQQQTETLSALTRQSLSLLTPDAASATISFDQLTYSKASSVSFLQSGNRTQFRSEQQSSLVGTGHITTASGEEFEFTAELDVAQVLDVRQTTQAAPKQAGNVDDNVVQLRIPKLSDLLAASSRLLDLLQQTTPRTGLTKPEKQDLTAQLSSKTSGLDVNLLKLLETLGNNTQTTQSIDNNKSDNKIAA